VSRASPEIVVVSVACCAPASVNDSDLGAVSHVQDRGCLHEIRNGRRRGAGYSDIVVRTSLLRHWPSHRQEVPVGRWRHSTLGQPGGSQHVASSAKRRRLPPVN
jgi:hypothetical protein